MSFRDLTPGGPSGAAGTPTTNALAGEAAKRLLEALKNATRSHELRCRASSVRRGDSLELLPPRSERLDLGREPGDALTRIEHRGSVAQHAGSVSEA